MLKVDELLRKSEIRTAILTIALRLDEDPLYTKENAISDLLDFLQIHNL